MKLFISADIEGTAGIVHWDETIYGREGYDTCRRQMTAEVGAVCRAAQEMQPGCEIVIKDAHDSGRNLLVEELPDFVRVFRGWARHPLCMMYGLDETFDGVALTGCHSAAGMNTNPLAHTMDTKAYKVTLNGDICPEAMINALTASYLGVPVLLLTGDRGLCEWMQARCPGTETVAVTQGTGNGAMSVHPRKAQEMIREATRRALQKDPASCLFPLPEHFTMEVNYIRHHEAHFASFYPGARLLDEKTVAYSSDDWMDVLRFIHFVL